MSAWQVIHGDCLEVLPTLGQVDHVITDPPYSERTHAGAAAAPSHPVMPCGSKRRGALGFEHLSAEVLKATALALGVTCKRWCVVFSDVEQVHSWAESLAANGLEHIRVGWWVKPNGSPQFTGDRPGSAGEAIEIAHRKGRKRWNGGGRRALFTHNTPALENCRREWLHTTQKPLPLMLELVELFTDPGDLVLDPFCGSGTTGVACLRLGRRFIGVEKDATYAAVARERLEAEARGLTLRDARAGQTSIFDVMGDP
jgi:site-specific DNA-methyltransferase (adenine-specific)